MIKKKKTDIISKGEKGEPEVVKKPEPSLQTSANVTYTGRPSKDLDDPYKGQGGRYVIRNGKRVKNE